jgi:hypothetical protein
MLRHHLGFKSFPTVRRQTEFYYRLLAILSGKAIAKYKER